MSTDGLQRSVKFVEGCGAPSERLLERAGIPPEITQYRDALVSHVNMYRFVELAGHALGTEQIGLHFAEQETLDNTSVIGPLLVNARSVKDFFICGTRFFGLKETATSFSLEIIGGTARFYHPKLLGPSLGTHQEDLTAFSYIIKHLRRVLGESWAPTTVNFEYSAKEPLTQTSIFGSSRILSGGAVSYLEFPAGILGIPIPQPRRLPKSNPVRVIVEAAQLPRSLVNIIDLQVRSLMRGRDSSIEMVARSVGLSPRTLQRQLMEQGTTFRSLISETRFQLACDWLSDSDMAMTVVDIAYALGYTDPSNFTRAFRARAGASPQKFRGTVVGS